MTDIRQRDGHSGTALRLLPAVVIVALQWSVRLIAPVVAPGTGTLVGVFAGVAGALAVLIWWVAFSRAPWKERVGAIVLTIIVLAVTPLSGAIDVSITTGAMGALYWILAVPALSLTFVAWAVATRGLSDVVRRSTMAATILITCGAFALVRTGGFTANFDNDLAWRWTPTAEERLLNSQPELPVADAIPVEEIRSAELGEAPDPDGVGPMVPGTADANAGEPGTVESLPLSVPDWPSFRGPDRDSVVARALRPGSPV
jgi:hypothetical protein